MNAFNRGDSYPLLSVPPQMSLIDIFFPGFSAVSASAHQLLAGNLNSYTRLLCICGVFVLFARYVSGYVRTLIRTYFTCILYVSYYDEAYDMLVDWLVEQPFTHNSHSLIARVRSTHRRSSQEKPLKYSPWNGSFLFWYKWHLLTLHFEVKDHRENIHISSIGRSPNILKELMEDCRKNYLNATQRKVLVFEHQAGEWKKAGLRPIRPMSTVIMDEKVKNDLLKDMGEYLDEPTQSWYAARGIPYRRGYLLSGPPGTGKSSFSLSIAGEFKLDIYTLNLSGVSDSTLAKLFRELPPQCVILMEDVDAAGVGERDTAVADQKDSTDSGVTLSGLLNVLDGVSSQEGRVLIMTTNHKEHLDEALIRPGRVDKDVCFELANKDTTTQLFRMIFKPMTSQERTKEEIDGEAVESLAVDFAVKVPERVFSPAEIQSFLLEHKKSPTDAISQVEDWVVKRTWCDDPCDLSEQQTHSVRIVDTECTEIEDALEELEACEIKFR